MNSKSSPLVSILLPTYNSMQYLPEAIESIFRQSYTNWELVVVHEITSSDETLSYLEGLHDDRIKIIKCHCPGNLSLALNIGIKNCRGEFIARMDSDDIMADDRLEKQVEFLEKNFEVGLCGSAVEIIGKFPHRMDVPTKPTDVLAELLFFLPVWHQTFMFRKELQLSYNETYQASEDYEVLTRVALQTKIANVSEILLFYRTFDGQSTVIKKEIGFQKVFEATKAFYNLLGLASISIDVCGIYGEMWRDVTALNCEDCIQKLLLELAEIYRILLKNKKVEKNSLIKAIEKRWEYVFSTQLYHTFDGKSRYIDSYYINSLKSKYDYLFKLMFEYDESLKIEKNEDPLITVIMPTYNVPVELYRSLLSIQRQTFENYEVFLVNDGGATLVKYILFVLNDERFRLIENEERLGIAESLNLGIRLSKAKYIARADADDWYRPKRFEKQVKFLEKNESVTFVNALQYSVYDDGRCEIYKLPKKHNDIKAQLLFHCCISHTLSMWRREDFLKYNLFYDKNYAMEDYELWNRAIMHVKFHCLQEPLGYYRTTMNSDNSTSRHGLMKMDMCQRSVVQKNLLNLDIKVPEADVELLAGWIYPVIRRDDPLCLVKVEKFRDLAKLILKKNSILHIYDQKALLRTLKQRWKFMIGDLNNLENYHINNIFGDEGIALEFVSTKLSACLHSAVHAAVHPFENYLARKMDHVLHKAAEKAVSTADYFLMARAIPAIEGHVKEKVKVLTKQNLKKYLGDENFTPEMNALYKQCLKDFFKDIRKNILARQLDNGDKHENVTAEPEHLVAETQVQEAFPDHTAFFSDYFAHATTKKLHINCGLGTIPGWLNTDLYPHEELGIYHLDLLKEFPFEDETFDFIFSEHGIEHFKIEEFAFILKECYRTLKKGGYMRVSTPDLKKLIMFYLTDSKENEEYLNLQTKAWLPFCTQHNIYSKALVLNDFFRNWGHQVIYDESTFKTLVHSVGFTNIKKCKIGQSEISELRGIDLHQEGVDECMKQKEGLESGATLNVAEFESMVFEFQKI